MKLTEEPRKPVERKFEKAPEVQVETKPEETFEEEKIEKPVKEAPKKAKGL